MAVLVIVSPLPPAFSLSLSLSYFLSLSLPPLFLSHIHALSAPIPMDLSKDIHKVKSPKQPRSKARHRSIGYGADDKIYAPLPLLQTPASLWISKPAITYSLTMAHYQLDDNFFHKTRWTRHTFQEGTVQVSCVLLLLTTSGKLVFSVYFLLSVNKEWSTMTACCDNVVWCRVCFIIC